MVWVFDDLPVLWVLGLEMDEYWPRQKVDELGKYLSEKTRHPIGMYQLAGKIHLMDLPRVDIAMYQYDVHLSWQMIYEETLKKRKAVGGKPFLTSEYNANMPGAKALGLAADFAGAAGVETGAPSGLAEFMEPQPDLTSPRREGSKLLLIGPADVNFCSLSRLYSF
jgi:hypothetical protein